MNRRFIWLGLALGGVIGAVSAWIGSYLGVQ
jgi:hypothetical protein